MKNEKYRGTFGGQTIEVTAENYDSAAKEICTILNIPKSRQLWVTVVEIK